MNRPFLASLYAPNTPRTFSDTDLLKLIAALCMLVDHVGKMFFPKYTFLRCIGRSAFPLYGYCLAVGATRTAHPFRYLSRIISLALLSQPLYALGLAHETPAMYAVPFRASPLRSLITFYLASWHKPSILLTLALALAILLLMRQRQFVLALAVYVFCERAAPFLDYGIQGIRFILLCSLCLEHLWLYLPAVLCFWLSWSLEGIGYSFAGHDFGMRIFALPAVLLTTMPLKSRCGIRIPKWISYGFYPAHLAVLALLTHLE